MLILDMLIIFALLLTAGWNMAEDEWRWPVAQIALATIIFVTMLGRINLTC